MIQWDVSSPVRFLRSLLVSGSVGALSHLAFWGACCCCFEHCHITFSWWGFFASSLRQLLSISPSLHLHISETERSSKLYLSELSPWDLLEQCWGWKCLGSYCISCFPSCSDRKTTVIKRPLIRYTPSTITFKGLKFDLFKAYPLLLFWWGMKTRQIWIYLS